MKHKRKALFIWPWVWIYERVRAAILREPEFEVPYVSPTDLCPCCGLHGVSAACNAVHEDRACARCQGGAIDLRGRIPRSRFEC